MPDIDDLFSDPNGPAYQAKQVRVGVPLDYVGQKLRSCIESLHYAIRGSPAVIPARQPGSESAGNVALAAQRGAFMYAIIAFLALQNMLGIASDPEVVAERLSAYARNELRDWLDQIEQGGSVVG